MSIYIYTYKQYTPANSSEQLEALTQYWILILSSKHKSSISAVQRRCQGNTTVSGLSTKQHSRHGRFDEGQWRVLKWLKNVYWRSHVSHLQFKLLGKVDVKLPLPFQRKEVAEETVLIFLYASFDWSMFLIALRVSMVSATKCWHVFEAKECSFMQIWIPVLSRESLQADEPTVTYRSCAGLPCLTKKI